MKNGEFEDKGNAWTINSSQIQSIYTTIDPHEGTTSAQLTNASSTSYGLEQTVIDILPNTTYKLSGFIKTDIALSKILLRIAWYSSPDGTGSQIRTDDSPSMTSTFGLWQPLEISARSPSYAQSAKVRLLLAGGTAVFDSIQFSQYNEPTNSLTSSPSSVLTPTNDPTPTHDPQNLKYIYISEVMSYPESGSHEWVELFNGNDFDVTLTDWYLDDGEDQGASPYLFSVSLPAHDYASIELETSLYNNAGDQVRLLAQDKKQKDQISYSISKKGYSWGRNEFLSNVVCLQTPSLDEQNSECLSIESKQVLGASLKPTPTQRPSGKDSTLAKPSEIKTVNDQNAHYKRYAIQPILHQTNEFLQNEDLYIPLTESRPSQNPSVHFLAISYSLLSFSSILMKLYRDSATL